MNCAAPDCQLVPRSKGSALCEKHYMRVYRRGSVSDRVLVERKIHANGYILIRVPEHPLALRRDAAFEYEHRVVFYNAHGEGPFACHWCECEVTWSDMHVDHKDGVRDNNADDNLVPSCAPCNIARGFPAMKQTQRANGHLLTHAGTTLCISEWALKVGVTPAAIRNRLRSGWPVARAVTEPRGSAGPA